MRLPAIAFVLVIGACHHAAEPALQPLAPDAYSHYLAGKLAHYREDPSGEIEQLTAAAKAAPDQPMIVVELARALAKAKRADEARALLAIARGKWPGHPQVWLESGELLEKAAPAEAELAFRRAITLAPDDERAYLGLARIEVAASDAPRAEATLRALIANIPSSVDGHYRLAQRLLARDALPEAIAELQAVLERDPDQIDARLDLARTLRRTGKLTDAIAQTRSAFDRAGEPMDVAEELFWLLCEADDMQGAVDLLTLLDDDRSDADALGTVARLDIGLGRLDAAAAIAQRLAGMKDGADEAAIVTLELDLANRDEAAALEHAKAVEASSDVRLGALRLAAETALDAGDPGQALVLARAGGDDLELALIAAMAEADQHKLDDARAIIAEHHRDAVAVALAQARLDEHAHDDDDALALLEPVIRSHPDNLTALNLAGYLLAERRTRLDDAERYLRRARELAPGDPAILDSWGWLLYARGRTPDALRALDQAARFAPREPEILLHLATVRAAAHDARSAAQLLDRAAGLHPTAELARKIRALRDTIRP
ncbi:MAG TPA: tetratricopeptide repeat protein [Kofleriaceae bacterium]|nr:tetratricopeptide repeat protein [Kofleriaceae bacterium]